MFYLMAFLSLLVGILVYMMDPAPADLRHSMDVRVAEVFVTPFLNQHQAAKEYLRHWLGMVYPGSGDNQAWSGDGAVSPTTSFKYNAEVMSLPKSFLEFLPSVVKHNHFDEYYHSNNTDIPLLQYDGNSDEGYVSALICLDSAGHFAPCYDYVKKESGSFSMVPGSDGVGPSESDIARVGNSGASPNRYLITYGIHRGAMLPPGTVATAQEKAERQELWVKALANRSRGTENCGFLMAAPGASSWCKNGGKIELDSSCADGVDYCVYNGNRCVSILPSAIQAYLGRAVDDNSEANLSDILFCMSRVSDPYEAIAPTRYHYDGINYYALGAEKKRNSDTRWYPAIGDIATEDAFLSGSSLGQQITLPILQSQGDFTLSFVMLDTETGATGSSGVGELLNVRDENLPGQLYAIKANGGTGSEKTFLFYPNTEKSVTVETRTGGEQMLYAWTIMRRNNKMYLFLNGCQAQDNENHICWRAQTPDPATNMEPITFGGTLGRIDLKDIRYYDHALTGRQLAKNFKLDMDRYGVKQLDCQGESRFIDIPSTGYPECH